MYFNVPIHRIFIANFTSNGIHDFNNFTNFTWIESQIASMSIISSRSRSSSSSLQFQNLNKQLRRREIIKLCRWFSDLINDQITRTTYLWCHIQIDTYLIEQNSRLRTFYLQTNLSLINEPTWRRLNISSNPTRNHAIPYLELQMKFFFSHKIPVKKIFSGQNKWLLTWTCLLFVQQQPHLFIICVDRLYHFQVHAKLELVKMKTLKLYPQSVLLIQCKGKMDSNRLDG